MWEPDQYSHENQTSTHVGTWRSNWRLLVAHAHSAGMDVVSVSDLAYDGLECDYVLVH